MAELKLPRSLPGGRGFRDLVIGQAVSAWGDWLGTVALMALVLELTGSPTAVGGVLVLRLAPSAVGAPAAAGFAERWDRRRTMLAMDLSRTVLVALIPLIGALWWVYLLAFLTEVANLVFLPARDAAIPELVAEEELPVANGVVMVSSYGMIPVGAAGFAALSALPAPGALGFRPFAIVFWVDALTYLASFAMIRRLPELGGNPATAEEGEEVSTLEGLKTAFALPTVRRLLPAIGTVVVGVGALFSVGIVFIEEVLGATTVQFGLLVVFFGLGAGLGVVWLHSRYDRPGVAVLRPAVAAMGVVLTVMSAIAMLWVSYLGAALFGAAGAVALVGATTFLQASLAGRERTLAFAAFHAIVRLGMSLGAIAAGLVAGQVPYLYIVVLELQPPATVLAGSGLLIVVGALAMGRGDGGEATQAATS